MFVSFGFRFKAEVEALNMAESVGNYARHRTAPIIMVETEGGRVREYRVTMAPAVSGQSIAYGYMSALVRLAAERGLPLSEQARRYEEIGGFFKRADNVSLSHDERVKTCVVEDLTGFMATSESRERGGARRGGGKTKGRKQEAEGESQEGGGEAEDAEQSPKGVAVKRTSPVMFSYMVPDATSARGVVVPQLHVRYNLQDQGQQALFQLEAGTAIYIHGVVVDVGRIGRLTNGYVPDRLQRVELAFDALKLLYAGLTFGAKKARYLPIFEPLGGVASVSEKPFVVTPPRFWDYVAENLDRAARLGGVEIYCFDREGITTCGAGGSKKAPNLEALIDEVKNAVLQKLKR